MSAIPHPGRLSPEFVSTCLREAGLSDVEVRSLRAARIGTGQTGLCFRYELELAGETRDAPTTLVAKGPSDDPTSRQTGVMGRTYAKEVAFYQELQPRLQIRTPRCYYAAIDGDGPDHLLLLEDGAPAVQGDQVAGCSTEVARAAVLELVGLHAPTWNDPSLLELEWLGVPSPQTVALGRAFYTAQLPAFFDRFRAQLEPDELELIESVATSTGPPFEPLGDAYSLLHVDYRLDNLLIDEASEPPRVIAVDWQTFGLGNPLSDVAYFLGAGLLPAQRRACEREIVAQYHEALTKAGIGDYDAERCWEDYRRGVFAGLAITVIASPIVEQTERGDAMFAAMARRHARHAIDLGSAEFLA